MKNQSWAIVDKDSKVVGSWFAGSHIVPIYPSKKAAIEDSKTMPFLTCVVKATPEVLTLQPSPNSPR